MSFMKRPALAAFAAFVVLFIIGASTGQAAGRPRLNDTSQYTYQITGCDGGTSNSLSIPSGDYIFSVQTEAITLCTFDAGCAAGGQALPASYVDTFNFFNYVDGGIASTPIGCNSKTADGGITLTRIAPGT